MNRRRTWILSAIAVFLVLRSVEASRIYVTNYATPAIHVIDSATDSVVATLPTSRSYTSVDASPDGTRLFAVSPATSTLDCLSAATGTIIWSGSIGSSANAVAVSPLGDRVYVVTGSPTGISVFNTGGPGAAVFVSDPRTGGLTDLAVSRDGGTLYLSDFDSGVVWLVDTASFAFTPSPSIFGASTAVAPSPDGKRLFVVDANGPQLLEATADASTIIRSFPVGTDPVRLVLSPDGTRAYVTGSQSNTLTVVDLATGTAGSPVGLGAQPWGVAASMDGSRVYTCDLGVGGAGTTVTAVAADTGGVVTTLSGFSGAFGAVSPADATETSDACQISWRGVPPPRLGHGLAWDLSRGRLVLFGGESGYATLADTWERTGGRWIRRAPLHSPTPRRSFGFVFDSIRGRIVLFGGTDGATDLGDTWEWDGTDWYFRLIGSPLPSPRAYPAMAFDESTGRVVLFGGSSAGTALSDSWLFDGSSWTPLLGSAPPAMQSPQLTYDRWRGEAVLVGDNQTWKLSGGVWSPVTTSPHPQNFYGGALVFDDDRGDSVLFGAQPQPSCNEGSETWLFGGSSWKMVDVLLPPGGRRFAGSTFVPGEGATLHGGGRWVGACYPIAERGDEMTAKPAEYWLPLADEHAFDGREWQAAGPLAWTSPNGAAYDSRRDRVVRFGGYRSRGSSPPALNSETWEHDGAGWLQRFPSSAPSPRALSPMAYDEERGVTLLFGGFTLSGVVGDTWAWDGSRWLEKMTPVAPAARTRHALAWDPARKVVVLFGGVVASINPWVISNETWEWNGAEWSLRNPASSPAPRYEAAMAWDRDGQRLVLYGGRNSMNIFGDSWAWDGSNWSPIITTNSPGLKTGATLAPAIPPDRLILAGGSDGSFAGDDGTLWSFDGVDWRSERHYFGPAERQDGTLIFDAHRFQHRLLGAFLGDEWVLGSRWRADATPSATEVCLGQAIRWTDQSKGQPFERTWAFGDGNTSTDASPIHTFAAAGTYDAVQGLHFRCGWKFSETRVRVLAGPPAEIGNSLRLAETDNGSIRATWADEPGVRSYRLIGLPAVGATYFQQLGEASSGNPGLEIGLPYTWPYLQLQGENACGVGP